ALGYDAASPARHVSDDHISAEVARRSEASASQKPNNLRSLSSSDNKFAYAASVATSIGSMIDGSSFSGLLTRAEIGHMRMSSAGNGRIRARGSASSPSQRA